MPVPSDDCVLGSGQREEADVNKVTPDQHSQFCLRSANEGRGKTGAETVVLKPESVAKPEFSKALPYTLCPGMWISSDSSGWEPSGLTPGLQACWAGLQWDDHCDGLCLVGSLTGLQGRRGPIPPSSFPPASGFSLSPRPGCCPQST